MTATHQWQSGTAGVWSDISGATALTYTETDNEINKYIRVAEMVAGVTAYSNQIGPIITTGATASLAGRLYAASSPWNKAIPDTATVSPYNADLMLGLKYVLGLTTGAETALVRTDNSTTNPMPVRDALFNLANMSVPALGTALAGTPTYTVKINYPTCGRTLTVPIPADMAFQSDENSLENSAAILAADGTEYNFFKFTKPGQTPILSDQSCFSGAQAEYVAAIAVTFPGGWQGSGITTTAVGRASGSSEAAGLVRQRDFQTSSGGTWDHAIAIVGGGVSDGSFYPRGVSPFSNIGDGNNNGGSMEAKYCVPYGARWQMVLPGGKTADMLNNDGTLTTGASGTAPEWKKQMVRTLQVYGAYAVDENYADVGRAWSAIQQYPYTLFVGLDGYSSSDTVLPPALWQYMRILDWTDSGNY